MAQRLEATAEGLLDGYDYRVEIYDKRYTNASIEGTLADERNWITWNVGEEDDDGTRPIKPHEVTLSVLNTTDVSVLRGAAEDDLRIEVYHDGSNTLKYKGYLSPNRIATKPLGPSPSSVTLSGTEGLPLLQKQAVDVLSWSSNDTVPYLSAILSILNELYPTSLSLEIGMQWYPDDGSLTSTDMPLRTRDLPTDAFREPPEEGGDWITLYEALKRLMRPFDFSIQQSRRLGSIAWWIVSWDAYKSDGHIDTWQVDPSGIITTTYRGDQDVVYDLDALSRNRVYGGGDEPENDPGAPGRLRQSVRVTYDHPKVQNFVQEGGFEGTLNHWAVSNPDVNAVVGDHSNYPDKTPSATASNSKLGVMEYNSDTQANNVDDYGFSQNDIKHVRPDIDAGLRFKWDGYQSQDTNPLLYLENSGVVFEHTAASTRAKMPPGEIELPISALQAPIGKGAKVPIRELGSGQHITFITLSERAETGDEKLIGETSSEVPDGANVWYITPTTDTSKRIAVDLFVPESKRENWGTQRIFIPYRNTSGNRLLSNNFDTLKLGLNRAPSGSGTLQWLFDNVRLQPVKNGQPLDQTVSTASVTEVGTTDELTQEFGSGPGSNTPTRIIGGFLWGVGAAPSDTWPISELRARQRERYFRQQNNRYFVKMMVEDKNPQFAGHETVSFQGDIHRVTAIEHKPSEGSVQLTLLQHNDYGTA